MDPITALAAATSAFNVIKRGFEVGRDLESMGSDIGRWMTAVGHIRNAEEAAKNPPLFKKIVHGKSVEEEAMNAFMAKKKAQDMRDQLREIIIYTRGMDAWQELLQMEINIRKQRADAEVKQKKARASFFENLMLSGATVAVIGLLIFLGWLFYKGLQVKGAL